MYNTQESPGGGLVSQLATVELTDVIDRAEIHVKGGDGGNGVVSFRHEKYVPFGGPDGGNGGRGGNVLIVGDPQLTTLHSLGGRKHWKAGGGGHGRGKNMQGRRGDDMVISVPLGTLVYAKSDGGRVLIADVTEEGQQEVVGRGGRGGFGNAHFTTSTNQAPRIAQRGEPGEEARLVLDLKLIADVGLVGYPSVGKSTLLGAASAARPKVAEYPFTTTEPVLGVVEVGNRTFVLAEVPGLIEGAHMGAGLGLDFLRHAERTKLLIHLLDGTSESPLADFENLNHELELFSPGLAQKTQILAVNKIDLPQVEHRIPELEEQLGRLELPLFFVSAATTKGVPRLMGKAAEMLQAMEVHGVAQAPALFRPRPREPRAAVAREGDLFVVSCAEAEKLAARMDLASSEARSYFRRQLARWGVVTALKRAGVEPGDKVRIGDTYMEWD